MMQEENSIFNCVAREWVCFMFLFHLPKKRETSLVQQLLSKEMELATLDQTMDEADGV